MTIRPVATFVGVLFAVAAGCAASGSSTGDRVETAGCASPSPGERVVVPDATMWNTTHDVDEMINRITTEGGSRFSGSYAGLAVDAEHGVTTVYRVPDADFDAFIREVAGTQCFRILPARYSRSALKPWMDRIQADLRSWTDSGLPLQSAGISNDGAGIRIGTRDVAATEAAFRERYGDEAPLIFVKEEGGISAQ